MADVINIRSASDFSDFQHTHDDFVVKLTAPAWCAPCRQLAPHYAATAEILDVPMVSIDIDDNPWAQEVWDIRSVPTVLLYKDGQVLKHLSGRTVVALSTEIKDGLGI